VGRKRLVSIVASLAVAAAMFGASGPAGVAQGDVCIDPNYCPQEQLPGSGSGSGTTATEQNLKQCIKKAKKKFRKNATKRKAAIKKCKQNYPLSV
jgi:hypothetical protein